MNANEKAIEELESWKRADPSLADALKREEDGYQMTVNYLRLKHAAVPPDVAGEPVAWQWRGLEQDEAPTQWLFETEDVINAWKGAVARSPQKYSIERRPLYSADALASLAARAEALAQLNARLEDHLYEARQSAEAEATRLRGELARVRAETIESAAITSETRWLHYPELDRSRHQYGFEIAAAIRALEPRHD